MAELGHSAAAGRAAAAKEPLTAERGRHPVYQFWHGHISTFISAQRPDTDAELIAHIILGALHSEPMLAELATDGPERLAAAIRALACAVLDAPPSYASARAGVTDGGRPRRSADDRNS